MPQNCRDCIFSFQKLLLGEGFALGARWEASLPLPLARFGNFNSLWLLIEILLTWHPIAGLSVLLRCMNAIGESHSLLLSMSSIFPLNTVSTVLTSVGWSVSSYIGFLWRLSLSHFAAIALTPSWRGWSAQKPESGWISTVHHHPLITNRKCMLHWAWHISRGKG